MLGSNVPGVFSVASQGVWKWSRLGSGSRARWTCGPKGAGRYRYRSSMFSITCPSASTYPLDMWPPVCALCCVGRPVQRYGSGIAIRGGGDDHDSLSAGNGLVPNLQIVRRPATLHLRGAVEAQQLLHGAPDQRGIGAQRFPPIGLPQEREQTIADQVRGRLMPRVQQQALVADQGDHD